MYRKTIDFDQTSFLEVASRITGSGTQLMLAMRGAKNDRETTVASVLLNKEEVRLLIEHLSGFLKESELI